MARWLILRQRSTGRRGLDSRLVRTATAFRTLGCQMSRRKVSCRIFRLNCHLCRPLPTGPSWARRCGWLLALQTATPVSIFTTFQTYNSRARHTFCPFSGVQLTPAVVNSGGTMLYGSRFSVWPGGLQVSFDIQYGAVSNNPCAYSAGLRIIVVVCRIIPLPAAQPRLSRSFYTKATTRQPHHRGRAPTRAFMCVSTRRPALHSSLRAPMD